METFPHTLMAVAEELIPCAAISFDSVNLKTGAATNCFDRPVALSQDELLARWQVFCHEHPGIAFLEKGGQASVFSFTDFVSQRQFEQSAFHNEITKPCGISHQLAVIFPVPGFVAGMALNRDAGFAGRERELVELLYPHFAQAFQNAQLYSSLRSVSEVDFRAWRNAGLTHRECEVLRWLMEGKRNGEIAIILGAQPRTIAKHVQNVMAKLEVETRTAAGAEARRLLQSGFIPPVAKMP